jgi:hypothetical protein
MLDKKSPLPGGGRGDITQGNAAKRGNIKGVYEKGISTQILS